MLFAPESQGSSLFLFLCFFFQLFVWFSHFQFACTATMDIQINLHELHHARSIVMLTPGMLWGGIERRPSSLLGLRVLQRMEVKVMK